MIMVLSFKCVEKMLVNKALSHLWLCLRNLNYNFAHPCAVTNLCLTFFCWTKWAKIKSGLTFIQLSL